MLWQPQNVTSSLFVSTLVFHFSRTFLYYIQRKRKYKEYWSKLTHFWFILVTYCNTVNKVKTHSNFKGKVHQLCNAPCSGQCIVSNDVCSLWRSFSHCFGDMHEVFRWSEWALEVKSTVWPRCMLGNADCMNSFSGVASVLADAC